MDASCGQADMNNGVCGKQCNVLHWPFQRFMFPCRVTLGDDEARRRSSQKSVQERAAPPTFDVAIELLGRRKWCIHPDIGQAVDSILHGVPTSPSLKASPVRSRSVPSQKGLSHTVETSDRHSPSHAQQDLRFVPPAALNRSMVRSASLRDRKDTG